MESLWKWLEEHSKNLLLLTVFCFINTACFAKAPTDNPTVKTVKPHPTAEKSLQTVPDQQAPAIQFQKGRISFGKKLINDEIAKTPQQHERGLMYRNSLPKDEGMLFIFDEERTLSFWMKNTYIDLAIAYFDKNQKIVDIQEMKATNSLMLEEPPSYPSAKPALYALEMNSGWFKKNNIKIGDQFSFK